MSTKETESKVTELMELKRMREELETEIAALEDEIKADMGDETERIAGAFKILWTPVTTNRLDTKALTKELPEIAAQYTKTTTSRRFSIH